ncbi:MFS general substrate transporter [Microthyrium microscopicum]|uniref:MFS general substrate transporter n=1 Tax=Microthyrium microscopicum TaxID=703497 RepID=A0A6A6UV09_9PEZI|nr:MFS general substrate transporter [Microthyrium microscopicum]
MITSLSSLSSGIITVGLPQIAKDVNLEERLYLWPSSVFSLTAGSTLLLAGAVADIVDTRLMELTGCTLLGIFTLALGFSQTGIQLVVFRALQGIAIAIHWPCSVSLVAQYIPNGKARNIGFACLGLAMPLGFSVGLLLGGFLVDSIGWRVGFYITGAIMLVQSFTGYRIVPAGPKAHNIMSRLLKELDWIGAMIACSSLAMFSYVLAILSADSDNIREPSAITMLVFSTVLMISFPVWMRFQEGRGRPALVPNKLWRNLPFTSICVMTILTTGVQNANELFSSLYFQEVQELSALQASLRLMPSTVIAIFLNFTTGSLIHRTPVFWLMLISTILTAGSPLLMALINPAWSYWKGAFFAQSLAPLGGDILFTVGLLIVSEGFPDKTQALAGAVYSTLSFLGVSLGTNLMQVVSLLVTKGTQYRDKSSPGALLQGYQASFWAMFALTMACLVICFCGLRNVGKIGLKRE